MQETKGSINLGRVDKSIGVYSIILPEKCWRNISLGENPLPSLFTVSVCVWGGIWVNCFSHCYDEIPTCVWGCSCTHGEQRLVEGVFLRLSPPYFSRWRLQLNVVFTNFSRPSNSECALLCGGSQFSSHTLGGSQPVYFSRSKASGLGRHHMHVCLHICTHTQLRK